LPKPQGYREGVWTWSMPRAADASPCALMLFVFKIPAP
jgi:hypothetical protein